MTEVVDRINDVFVDAGCQGWLRAQPIGRDAPVVDVGGTEPVVAASVYKVIVLVALARAFDAGQLDPVPASGWCRRTAHPGPPG